MKQEDILLYKNLHEKFTWTCKQITLALADVEEYKNSPNHNPIYASTFHYCHNDRDFVFWEGWDFETNTKHFGEFDASYLSMDLDQIEDIVDEMNRKYLVEKDEIREKEEAERNARFEQYKKLKSEFEPA